MLPQLLSFRKRSRHNDEIGSADLGAPSIALNKSLITKSVRADLEASIRLVGDIDRRHATACYAAALDSAQRSGHLASLFRAIIEMNISGMDRHRAGEIATFLSSRTSAMIAKERLERSGITQAIWVYTGSFCKCDGSKASERQNEAHRAANGTSYEVRNGLLVGGKMTWPGREWGCKCLARPIVKRFS